MDTPTSTLWQGRDAQNRAVIAQAERDFGLVEQSLNTDKASFPGSDSVDLERGRGEDPQETFNLREYLTSSNDESSAAGIKHKHVGVTWEDLEVSAIGGEQNKVRHFMRHPSPFYLMVCDRQIHVSTCAGKRFCPLLHSYF